MWAHPYTRTCTYSERASEQPNVRPNDRQNELDVRPNCKEVRCGAVRYYARKAKQNKTKQSKTKQNKAKQNKAKHASPVRPAPPLPCLANQPGQAHITHPSKRSQRSKCRTEHNRKQPTGNSKPARPSPGQNKSRQAGLHCSLKNQHSNSRQLYNSDGGAHSAHICSSCLLFRFPAAVRGARRGLRFRTGCRRWCDSGKVGALYRLLACVPAATPPLVCLLDDVSVEQDIKYLSWITAWL